jgi:hypothetical protein
MEQDILNPIQGEKATVDTPESVTTATTNGQRTVTMSISIERMYPGLYKACLNSVDTLYAQLDKLENSGLALGLDILPHDIPLADSQAEKMFSGAREMLWIEYTSTKEFGVDEVKGILKAIAEVIAPYPVCAYDDGEFGLGLLVHDGVPDAPDGKSPSV